ncbi:hypothetical protein BD289DRAFT_411721 [Coniella lustricola]|uniref:Cupin type-1 domain-containing protein n=1 Tax=Coniella lustricola TaxID=2025994 RepID=A0A2T3A4E8_9PEZI|nr:hypothetical protein BD289DRAFT_411721 [Coniella lustricola]
MHIQPLSSLRVSKYVVPAHNRIPNSSITNKPLLIYHSAFLAPSSASSSPSSSSSSSTNAKTTPTNKPASISPAAIEAHLHTTAAVVPQWRYTMYPTTHFHSTTHEVLCVFSGRATLCFGGEANPGKVQTCVCAGDVLVVPAGVGHCLVREEEEEEEEGVDAGAGKERFAMIGSYPPGCQWDMCYGNEGEEEKVEGIKELKWLEKDPVYGEEGPVLGV